MLLTPFKVFLTSPSRYYKTKVVPAMKTSTNQVNPKSIESLEKSRRPEFPEAASGAPAASLRVNQRAPVATVVSVARGLRKPRRISRFRYRGKISTVADAVTVDPARPAPGFA